MVFILATILLIFVTFLIYLEVSQLFNVVEVIDKEILQASYNVISKNTHNEKADNTTFNIIIGLFKTTDSSYPYYPSYFVPVSGYIEYYQNIEPLSKCEQCKVINDLINITLDHAETLRDIFEGLRL